MDDDSTDIFGLPTNSFASYTSLSTPNDFLFISAIASVNGLHLISQQLSKLSQSPATVNMRGFVFTDPMPEYRHPMKML
jgi:hypothetical protein